MTAACVLDASVVARWWLTDPHTDTVRASRALLDAHLSGELAVHIPDLLYLEVANALWKASRFGHWQPPDVKHAVEDLGELPLERHEHAPILPAATDLAITYEITVYDACYIALAGDLGLPLFTADRRLLDRLAGRLPQVVAVHG